MSDPILTPDQFRARLAETGGKVIDVRTPAEYAEGHLDGAPNLDVLAPSFAARAADLPREATYFLYCRSGGRSGQAAQILRQMGLHAHNVGGYDALAAAGFPTDR